MELFCEHAFSHTEHCYVMESWTEGFYFSRALIPFAWIACNLRIKQKKERNNGACFVIRYQRTLTDFGVFS